MTEKPYGSKPELVYTEAELHAAIAAAYEAVAEHQIYAVNALKFLCTCSKEFDWREIDGVRKPSPAWREHIRSLTPASALSAQAARDAEIERKARLDEAKLWWNWDGDTTIETYLDWCKKRIAALEKGDKK